MEIVRFEHSVVTVKGLVYAVRQIRVEPFARLLHSARILKASGHRQRVLFRYFCKYTRSLRKRKCSSTVVSHGGSVEQCMYEFELDQLWAMKSKILENDITCDVTSQLI